MSHALVGWLTVAAWFSFLAVIGGWAVCRLSVRRSAPTVIRLEVQNAAAELEHVVGALARAAQLRGLALLIVAYDLGSHDETPLVLERLERRYDGLIIWERTERPARRR
ncbi:MAG: hypothetical protein IMW86_07695 [Hydrogenibacillus sp.]|nr:hypothetical protein [Hydrogenibacillus sp.]